MIGPLPIPVKDPAAPQCRQPYLDWQGHTWSCCLPPNHVGDHYAEEGKAWCWYGPQGAHGPTLTGGVFGHSR